MEIPYDKIMMVIIALAIIYASTQLAMSGVAPWHDVYTLFLIILSGIGFISAAYYAGEARVYRRMYELEHPSKSE